MTEPKEKPKQSKHKKAKNKCKGCGFPIAEWEDYCGECACEDDCRPN